MRFEKNSGTFFEKFKVIIMWKDEIKKEETYGEPTDSLRRLIKMLFDIEDALYDLGASNDPQMVSKEQRQALKRAAQKADRFADELQDIIDMGQF